MKLSNFFCSVASATTVCLSFLFVDTVSARENPQGPSGDLTITVTEMAGGNVNFSMSGSTTAKSTNSNYQTPSSQISPPSNGVANTSYSLNGLSIDIELTTNLNTLEFNSSVWYLSGGATMYASSVGLPVTGSGSVTTNAIPFSNFVAGTFPVIGDLYDITYVVVPYVSEPTAPMGPVPTGSPSSEPEDPILVVNQGAINSANSGLAFSGANQSTIQNLSHMATGDLNDRLFRARSQTGGGNGGGGAVVSTLNQNGNGQNSLARFLNFAGGQNIDYRVALGLAEGEEVEYVDTLASSETVWMSHPYAMVGGPVSLGVIPVVTKAVVAVPGAGGKDVVEEKGVVMPDAVPSTRYEVFTEFDYGFYDQDRLTRSTRGFETDSYVGTLGFEYQATDWLQVGLAWSHAWSQAELNSNLGGVEAEGDLATVYLTAFYGATYLDFLYSYGSFENDTNRNTLLGSRAHGSTDSDVHNFAFNVGHSIAVTDQIVTGPFAGLNYSNGSVDGYRETGGGTANLIYSGTGYESMIGRLGWSVSHTQDAGLLGTLTSQLRAGWAHEFMPESDTYSATLATSPFSLISGGTARSVGGYSAVGDDAHAGTDWLELGAGVRFDLDRNWNFRLDYEGQFGRNNATAHFGTARVGYEW